MFDYALKNIGIRWVRSLLTVTGVTLMLTLVIVITGIVAYQTHTMHAHASAGAGKLNMQPLLAGEGYPAAGVDMPAGLAEEILRATGDLIQPALSTGVLYYGLEPPLYPNQPPEILLVGIPPGMEEAFTGSISHDVRPVSGVESFPCAGLPAPVILGEHAAEFFGARQGDVPVAGDRIEILGESYTVIGVLEHSADVVVNNAVLVPLDLAQEALDKPGFVSSVILTAADLEADEGIRAVVREKFPRLRLVSDDTIRRNAREGIQVFERMVNTIAAVVVISASLLIMTVMLITIKERTREIGVLRALGASQGLVVRSVLWEVFLLSAVGCLSGGVLSGLLLAFALEENLFDLGHILSYMPLSLVLTLCAGALPVAQIARVQPVDALRYE